MKRWMKYLCFASGSLLLLSGCAGVSGRERGLTGLPDSRMQEADAESVLFPATSGVASSGAAQKRDAGELSPEMMRSYGIILRYDSAEMLLQGEPVTLNAKPVLKDGVLFLPVSDLIVRMGGSFVSAEDVFYLNYGGNVSAMMTEYNVMLFNSDSYVMDAAPFQQDGVFYLPADGAAKALSMRLTVCPEQQILVLGLSGTPQLCDLRGLKELIDGSALEAEPLSALTELAAQSGTDYDTVFLAAASRRLWQTNAAGDISALRLDAAGTLTKMPYLLSYRYPPDMVYMADDLTGETGSLCLPDGTPTGEMQPELLCSAELRAATCRYMELRAAAMLHADEKAALIASAYAAAIAGDLRDPGYQQDQTEPYETKLYSDAPGTEAEWKELISHAQTGDFLLFSSEEAAAEYGCFNHSALILSAEDNTLHLLHARGSEYGVGADQDMDYLTWDMLCSHDYYCDYETVFLCSAGDLTAAERDAMTAQAYADYNGYQFGYGGRMGLQEVNCTELIDNAYANAGAKIISGDYDTRLKEVLKGNTRNLVVIPDDLMFSDMTEVKAVWKR